jgi:ATP-dependent RNA helicase DDX10/DBP4
MFGRKNQNVLSKSYRQLVDDDVDEEEDFITLKRADHDLPPPATTDLSAREREINLSKKKLKLGKAKVAKLKYGDLGKKLVFDEEGNAHELYEVADVDEVFGDGADAVKEAGQRFAEEERGKMKIADVEDKREAKEKREEKKRKRREREKEVSLN